MGDGGAQLLISWQSGRRMKNKRVKGQNVSFEAISSMSYLLQLGFTLYFPPHPNYVTLLHHQEINPLIRTKPS